MKKGCWIFKNSLKVKLNKDLLLKYAIASDITEYMLNNVDKLSKDITKKY